MKRFENRDAAIFQRVVKAMADRDQARANIYATELGEIRKVEKMLTQASIALESVSMRLKTVSEVGDLVAMLAPAAGVLNNIRSWDVLLFCRRQARNLKASEVCWVK